MISLGCFALAVAAALVWFLTRPKPPVILPPAVQARQALEALRQLAEDGALLSRVSQILRRYFAAAFGLPPGELTTAEFCRALAGLEPVGSELAGEVSDFLRQCDQRKFAPAAPAPPLGAVAQALKLIDLAEARLAWLRQAAQTAATASPAPSGASKAAAQP